MEATWLENLRAFARRNRPSQKPQLWENFPLAMRRRIEFEVAHRLSDDWLDRGHVVTLSQVGFDDGRPPLRMQVIPRELMNKALYLYGTFEISETRLTQALLHPGMTLIDVGANIGYYSLVGARLVGPTGVVHSFEPNAAVRSRLADHVEMNGFRNIVLHDRAVTRSSGTIKFYVSAVRENDGISSTIPREGLENVAAEVPCVSLDEFVAAAGLGHVDLVKIDVEGAELDVFEGGRRVLGAAEGPALLFESFDIEAILPTLRDLGYHARRLHYTLSGGLELRALDDASENLFAAYEAPNYFALKDAARFEEVLRRANANRPAVFEWLGGL